MWGAMGRLPGVLYEAFLAQGPVVGTEFWNTKIIKRAWSTIFALS